MKTNYVDGAGNAACIQRLIMLSLHNSGKNAHLVTELDDGAFEQWFPQSIALHWKPTEHNGGTHWRTIAMQYALGQMYSNALHPFGQWTVFNVDIPIHPIHPDMVY